VQALRHMRAATASGGAHVGRTFVRLTVVACVAMVGFRTFSGPLHLAPPHWPINPWIDSWVGPGHFGTERADIIQKLDRIPGNHLVLVRYQPGHEPIDEWVYNEANLDSSRVIWASDLDPRSNQELMRFYGDRDVWLVQPDVNGGKLSPYPSASTLRASR